MSLAGTRSVSNYLGCLRAGMRGVSRGDARCLQLPRPFARGDARCLSRGPRCLQLPRPFARGDASPRLAFKNCSQGALPNGVASLRHPGRLDGKVGGREAAAKLICRRWPSECTELEWKGGGLGRRSLEKSFRFVPLDPGLEIRGPQILSWTLTCLTQSGEGPSLIFAFGDFFGFGLKEYFFLGCTFL